MISRYLMMGSSVCLLIAGLACLFAPTETLSALGLSGGATATQLLGAVYLAGAAANWSARASMIGGIYARPLTLANFMHFMIGAMILLPDLNSGSPLSYITVSAVYAVLALLFTLLLYGRLGLPSA